MKVWSYDLHYFFGIIHQLHLLSEIEKERGGYERMEVVRDEEGKRGRKRKRESEGEREKSTSK